MALSLTEPRPAVAPAAVAPAKPQATRERHALHADDCVWVEKNCYLDLWIELLHSLRCDPMACLTPVFGFDFEGDQWTFVKPNSSELRDLYGIDLQELTVWRPLLDHALEHLAAGKRLAVEVDAYWLPETNGTDYRTQHSKTTILLNSVDVAGRRLGYFHNAGYFVLEGEDFDGLFAPSVLPPYAELIRIDQIKRLDPAELRARSRRQFEAQLAFRAGRDNPVRRFSARFANELPMLQSAGLATFHRWAFAGMRQWGAASELAALYLGWLSPEGEWALAEAAFMRMSKHAKTLLLKSARAVNSGKPLDASALLEDAALDHDLAFTGLF